MFLALVVEVFPCHLLLGLQSGDGHPNLTSIASSCMGSVASRGPMVRCLFILPELVEAIPVSRPPKAWKIIAPPSWESWAICELGAVTVDLLNSTAAAGQG